MNSSEMLAWVGGTLMLGVFGINVYIGLYDSNLAQLSPLHSDLNWVIAAADLIAAVVLFVKSKSTIWKSLAGIVWPVAYVASLFVDVETRPCLGSSATSCFPSTADAYNYLILGSSSEEWVLWPYAIRVAIILSIAVLALTLVSFAFIRTSSDKKVAQRVAIGPQKNIRMGKASPTESIPSVAFLKHFSC